MAEELQAAEICSWTWWSSPRTMFEGCSSPCSCGITVDAGNFMWPSFDLFDIIKTSNEEGPICNRMTQEEMLRKEWNPKICESSIDNQDLALNRNLSCSTLLQCLFEPINEENLVTEDANNRSIEDYMSSFLKSSLPDPEKSIFPTAKRSNGRVQDYSNEISEEPVLKRPRIETPSPLPSFKVRKEKLGDRITALQQLVSPFGKTDTASVLNEAVEYIKFLHDQVHVLSNPFVKQGPSSHHHQSSDTLGGQDSSKQDLRSRGLCLVPVSSTFPVAGVTTDDFWTLGFRTFG